MTQALTTMHDLDAEILPLHADLSPDCDQLLREVQALPPAQVVAEVRARWPQIKRDNWAFALLLERMARERLYRPYSSLSEWGRHELGNEAWVISKNRTGAKFILGCDPDDRYSIMESVSPTMVAETGLADLAAIDQKGAVKLAKQGLTQAELKQAVRERLAGPRHLDSGAFKTIHAVVSDTAYDRHTAALHWARFMCQTAHPTLSDLYEFLAIEAINGFQIPQEWEARFPRNDIESGRIACIDCKATNPNDLERHHVYPRSAQGHDGPCVWLCSGCHRKVTESVDVGWRDALERWMARSDLAWLKAEVETWLAGRANE